MWHHVPGRVDSHKGQITVTLHFSDLFAVVTNLQILQVNFIVCVLSRPVESLSPGVISEPVADEIRITLYIMMSARSSSREQNSRRVNEKNVDSLRRQVLVFLRESQVLDDGKVSSSHQQTRNSDSRQNCKNRSCQPLPPLLQAPQGY